MINSHYHFDHCGGNKYLTTACTVCHSLELEACTCHQPFEHLGYSDMSFNPAFEKGAEGDSSVGGSGDPEIDIYTPRFETIKGDQEIAKGLWLFETPGHTAGHYSMMVELANRRPMLFTADACYSKKSMEMMCIASFHLDPTQNLQSMQRLKDLAEKHDAELFYSHDPETWDEYIKAPDGHYS